MTRSVAVMTLALVSSMGIWGCQGSEAGNPIKDHDTILITGSGGGVMAC